MATNLKNYKEEQRAQLLRTYSLAKSTRAVVISYILDEEIRNFLEEALASLGVAIIEDTQSNRSGTDAFITDHWEKIPLGELVKEGIVPIGPLDGSKNEGLIEFNPMKFEGNCFLFDTTNKFQIFAAIVRYLENVKYPGDKRTLLKNITEHTHG